MMFYLEMLVTGVCFAPNNLKYHCGLFQTLNRIRVKSLVSNHAWEDVVDEFINNFRSTAYTLEGLGSEAYFQHEFPQTLFKKPLGS